MQNLVLGVSRMRGVGKVSKNPYDIAKVLVLNPIKPFSREGLSVAGYGYEVAEVSLSPEAVEQFASVKFPCQLDLETDMITRAGKLEPIVVGIRKAA